MDIHSYAKTLDTIGWFLGADGWPKVQPLLEKKMNKEKIIGLGFFMHDETYYQIKFHDLQ